MSRLLAAASAFVAACLAIPDARAQTEPAAELRIVWEAKNRFRLFRHEADFQRHVAAHGADGVLGAERRLASGSVGRGWARLMLNGLCVDGAGNVTPTCERDGVRESYLAPADHRIGVRLEPAQADAECTWRFEQADQEPQQFTRPCAEDISLRVIGGAPAVATVDVSRPGGTAARATAEILVRDLLIAGLGDSIASGEGNPDRPIALADNGFCFRRILGGDGSQYYRPSRAGYRGMRSCEGSPGDQAARREWLARGADWVSNACHRSLYSYQLRAALALAIENPHTTVTFVPLACTGAQIEEGLFQVRAARELRCRGGGRCPALVPPQIPQAKAILDGARRARPNRVFDLIFLTVGANDIYFSELVGNVLLDRSRERSVLENSGAIASVADAQRVLQRELPGNFTKLRDGLKPLVGGNLERVVYVSYANPALNERGEPCDGGRAGVDVHPAFRINGPLLRDAISFVEKEFLPRLKALARCENGVICKDANSERMTFVDAHQEAFRTRGFCARSEDDPAFDRACFSPQGDSFRRDLNAAAERPLACEQRVREFRAYASRARWIRTPNDSYFAAMTYPDGDAGSMQPADIHDGVWGVLSAVYGGAIHPTAEGHAAMADAALTAARGLLAERGVIPQEAQPPQAAAPQPLPPEPAGEADEPPAQ